VAFGVVFCVSADLGRFENPVILKEDEEHVLVGRPADGNMVLSITLVESVGGDTGEDEFSAGVMGLGL